MHASLSTNIEQWIEDLQAEQHSHNTVHSHRYAIRMFERWLMAHHPRIDVHMVTTEIFVEFVRYLKERRPPLEESTIFAYSGVLVRWVQYLIDEGVLAGIPNHRGTLVTPAKIRSLLERLLDRRETHVAPRVPDLRRLPVYFDQCLQTFLVTHKGGVGAHAKPAEVRTFLNLLRNRALIAILFSSGGRVNEVVGLEVAGVVRGSQVVDAVPIRGKGRKRRPLRLDTFAQTTVAAYLEARKAFFPHASAVFISHGPKSAGQQLSDVTAWRVVKEAANALADVRLAEGADSDEVAALRKVSPHSLRHYLAQAMLDEGADYKDITALLGHSSSVVTEQFYARIADDRALEVADTFAPRAAPSFGNDTLGRSTRPRKE